MIWGTILNRVMGHIFTGDKMIHGSSELYISDEEGPILGGRLNMYIASFDLSRLLL